MHRCIAMDEVAFICSLSCSQGSTGSHSYPSYTSARMLYRHNVASSVGECVNARGARTGT